MRLLEKYMMKLLAGSFLKSEFENELYQEHYIEKMPDDRLIENLISINFNDKFWKAKVKAIAVEHFGEDKFLALSMNYNCLQIIDSSNKEEIFKINNAFARINIDYDYQHEWLMKFYVLDDEIDYTKSGYGHRKEEEILKEIKSVARNFLDKFPTEN